MSLAAMHWARQSLKKLPDDVRAPARLALMLIADYADEDHICWPSIATMSLEMGCSERTVQRVITVLVEHGLLEVERRHAANGRQQSNRYRLAVGCQFVTPTKSRCEHLYGEGDSLTPTEGDKLTGEGDTTVGGRVSLVSPLESTTVTHTPSLSGAGTSPFDRAKQFDDHGRPPGGQTRKLPMNCDWAPDPSLFAAMAQRRGLPANSCPTSAELVDFADHFVKTGEVMTYADWHRRLARWIHENRRRQPMISQAPTGGSDHAKRRQSDSQGDERRRVREALADPHDTSWADGWWPTDDTEAATEPGAGAGGAGVHPSGGDLSEDVLECVPECGPVEAEQTGAGAGDSELAGAADSHGGGASHEQPEARGQYMATDDSGIGLDAGADSRGLWNASSW